MPRPPIIEKILQRDFLLSPHERETRQFLEESAELSTLDILQTMVSRIDTDPYAFFLSLSSNAVKNIRAHQTIIEDNHTLPYLELEKRKNRHHQLMLEQNRTYALDNKKDFTSDHYAYTYAQRYQATLPTLAQTFFDTTGEHIQPIHFALSCLHDVTATTSNLGLLFVQDEETIASTQQLIHSFGLHRMNDFRLRFHRYSRAVDVFFKNEHVTYQYLGPLQTSDKTVHQLFMNYSEVHHHQDKAQIQHGAYAQASYGFQPQVASGLR